MNNNGKKPGLLKALVIYVLIFVVVAGFITLISGGSIFGRDTDTKDIEFSELIGYLDKSQVEEIEINENNRSYVAKLRNGQVVVAYAPSISEMDEVSRAYIVPQSAAGTLTVKSVKPSGYAGILSWIPTIIMIVLMVILLRSMMGGGGNAGVMNFGKSRARMVKADDKKRITFADVAGLEEEKQELSEIVDFLKNPRKYLELGARIPKGVLLVGPPGTGKTYISKAVAGEAGVPFFSISGSDFVEMFVGVGASRVRDLFSDAKKNAPCIVFIDEIDAVGRRRGAGIGGGNDEREQTLNQLLVEMDGFDANEGIIVMAATNRPDVLDPAILRPGRFDRQVTISTPDVKGREEVFKIYAKNKPLDENVDLKVLAKRTPGFTPADIENMMNEAALLTARRNGTIIHMDDLEEAITRVIAGPQKRSRVMSDKERRLTAYHEAGHAIAAYKAMNGDLPVELRSFGMETAEVHSMSMEFFAWKWMDLFFGDKADEYRYMHFLNAVSFIPYGTMVDYFQQCVYEKPEMTPAERKQLWLDLEAKFRPYMSSEGITYMEEGGRWQYQSHIYERPFYYIDYCLAQTVAFDFLIAMKKDYDDAFARYDRFASAAGSEYFTDLVRNAGFKTPFEAGALKDIVDNIK